MSSLISGEQPHEAIRRVVFMLIILIYSNQECISRFHHIFIDSYPDHLHGDLAIVQDIQKEKAAN